MKYSFQLNITKWFCDRVIVEEIRILLSIKEVLLPFLNILEVVAPIRDGS